MRPPSSFWALFSFAVLLLALPIQAIKFDLVAKHEPEEKCIWNYALTDTLVVVTINAVSEGNGDGHEVDVQIVDGSQHHNVYWSQRDVRAETRMAINTHSTSDLGVCFTDRLSKSMSSFISHSHVADPSEGMRENPTRPVTTTIDLDVDIGAEALDYNAVANQESLSGLETELRKLEAEVDEILKEMEYLKRREQRMRDTNESTNQRVRSFAWLTIIGLVAVGTWQIFHLRNFFRKKYLID